MTPVMNETESRSNEASPQQNERILPSPLKHTLAYELCLLLCYSVDSRWRICLLCHTKKKKKTWNGTTEYISKHALNKNRSSGLE